MSDSRSGLPLRTAALALGSALAFMATWAVGQQPPTPTPRTPAPPIANASPAIGLVDIGAVLRNSKATQSLKKQIENEQDRMRTALDEEQRQLREAGDAIERDRGSLSSDAYAERRRAFQERVNKVEADFRLRRRQLEEAITAADSEISEALSAVIEELATNSGVSIIIRREAVLFQRNAVDLTDAALALLDEKLPQVEVSVPGATP